jgi:hypothetical protein
VSLRDFGTLIRRAGLSLSAAHLAQMREVWVLVEPLIERVRANDHDHFREPAQVFAALVKASSDIEAEQT